MPALTTMLKTVSGGCNLDCAYCYHRASAAGGPPRVIEWEVLERFVPQYLDHVADVGAACLGWQGGEPTLAGLDFFRRVVALEARHAHPGTVIDNDLQTNGLLIDEAWAELLAGYRFLVGISLDGPEDCHDAQRRDRGERGSFGRVLRAVELLERHGVELSALCVVGPHNVARGRELLGFFSAHGIDQVQIIPAMGFQATDPHRAASYLIDPEAYGALLVELFDEWYADGLPRIAVRTFDNLVRARLDEPVDACIQAPSCQSGLVVEPDGGAFPCDFYLDPEYELGNLNDHTLAAILAAPLRAEFVARKRPLPAECAACPWLAWCNGGCPRNRPAAAGAAGPDFFCASYRRLFAYADERLAELAARVRCFRASRAAVGDPTRSAPGRNDPCPCGSGRKWKRCCDDPALTRSYWFSRNR